jgi:hypothetical protein
MEWIKVSEQWPPKDYESFLYFDGDNAFIAYFNGGTYELMADTIQCHFCLEDMTPKCGCPQGPLLFVKPTDYWAKFTYPEIDQPERSKREDLDNEDAVL